MVTIATPSAPPERETGLERETGPALRHGLRGRCPNCGEGRIFAGYLKVADECASCGEGLHHHRADDIPAYLTILIVAHLVGFALPFGFDAMSSAPVTLALLLGGAATALSLLLLPPIKGMVVALQWAKRMGGFGRSAG